MIGEDMLSDMAELGRQELIAAVSGQEMPIVEAADTTPVEAPPSFEAEVFGHAALIQDFSEGMEP